MKFLSPKRRILLPFMALAGLATSASAANLITNPGFEAGTGADADNWNEIASDANASTVRSTLDPNSGLNHAYMTIDNTGTPSAPAIFIDQTSAPNVIDDAQLYNLSFFARTDTNDFTGMNIFAQIQWLDLDNSDGGGVKGETLETLIGLGINDTYQQFFINDLDPGDGADGFLIRFQLAAGPVQDIANGFYVDDTVLEQVPEPSSVGLLALGGLLFAKRRRKRA